MRLVQGGYNTYRFTIGIMMLESTFPRIPGDTGNASSLGCPARSSRSRASVTDV